MPLQCRLATIHRRGAAAAGGSLRCGRSSARPSARTLSSAPLASTVGFIGVGNMGGPMAANLSAAMDAGQSLVIFDVNAAAAAEVAVSLPNATVAGSVAEVAAQSATVITMVPETSHVEAVYLGGAPGHLHAPPPTTLPMVLWMTRRTAWWMQTAASSRTLRPARC
jgi:hypothetical protein